MSKRIWIEIRIAEDDDTGLSEVEKTFVESMNCVYGWELRTVFEKMAEKINRLTGLSED